MTFGIIRRTCPEMRQVAGFADRSTGRGTFGATLGRANVTNGHLLSQRRDPLPKLLWADLFVIIIITPLRRRSAAAYSRQTFP